MGWVWEWLRSFRSCLSQNASLHVSDKAMNSASVVERDTQVCFLQHQLMAPPFIKNIYPEFDFRFILSAAQLASAYPMSSCSVLLSLLRLNFKFDVPFRYFRTRLSSIQSTWLGDAVFVANIDTLAAISGLVFIAIYNKLPTSFWYFLLSSNGSVSIVDLPYSGSIEKLKLFASWSVFKCVAFDLSWSLIDYL